MRAVVGLALLQTSALDVGLSWHCDIRASLNTDDKSRCVIASALEKSAKTTL
jgi:hypothetical protein